MNMEARNSFDDLPVAERSWAFLNLSGRDKEHEPVRVPRIVSASASVNPLDDVVLVSGNSTLTLESAVACDGRKHTFIKTDSGTTMTIAGTPSIDGVASLATGTQYAGLMVVSNGTTWNAIRLDIATALGILAVVNGGTGRATGTTAYALVATGTTATGAQQTLASGATTEILVGGGASALPVWTTATGSGAPVRATSPTIATPVINSAAHVGGTWVADATWTLPAFTLGGAVSGTLTLPNQPFVLASANAQTNVTGDNTEYTILWANEIADRGGNFSSPTFTAPVTGLYRFGLALGINGMTTHTRLHVKLVTSNRTYGLYYTDNFPQLFASGGFLAMSFSQLADMDAADTASVTVTVTGGAATKIVSITAAGADGSYFSVELAG